MGSIASLNEVDCSQWKRAVTAAAVSACNGLGGIAGSFIVRQDEAPRYMTAIWVSIGYVTMSSRLMKRRAELSP